LNISIKLFDFRSNALSNFLGKISNFVKEYLPGEIKKQFRLKSQSLRSPLFYTMTSWKDENKLAAAQKLDSSLGLDKVKEIMETAIANAHKELK
jgi:hypothetical protein